MDEDETVESTEGVEETEESTVPEADVYEAKIAQLEADLAAQIANVSNLTAQLAAAKAANYDLLTQTGTTAAVDEVPADEDVSIDDLLFQEED